MKKPVLVVVALVCLAAAGLLLARAVIGRAQSRTGYETQPLRRGGLLVTIEDTGVVRAAQSAELSWQTSGTVEAVNIHLGQPVSSGVVLASLEQTSLPQPLILAQLDLIAAQRALDDLLQSQVQGARAQKALQDAGQALEEALHPQWTQAQAQAKVAQARKAVEDAVLDAEIARSPASSQAIQSAYSTLLLWSHALERTQQEIESVQSKLKASAPGAPRESYQAQLESLLLRGVKYRRSYEDALARYQDLRLPPDPASVAAAEAGLALAQARLDGALRDEARVNGGESPAYAADVAVLRAQLEDARREAERLEDGPDPQEIAAAQARLAAAQAALGLQRQIAPFDGVVTRVSAMPGDQVAPGSPAFRLDDLSSLLLEVRVSEVDINRIQAGQAATIRLDAVTGREYRGVVVEVPDVGEADPSGDIVSFRVRVEIVDADERVRPGMTASAAIVVTEINDTLLAPGRAVRMVDGQRAVYVLRNGEPTPVPVTLGASSSEDVQILGGDLQPGELIVMNPEE